MSQANRLILGVVIILLVFAVVLGVDLLRRQQQELAAPEIPPGAVPIYVEDQLVGSFVPGDLEKLKNVSFEDNEEGKTQEGWRLEDTLLLYIDEDLLRPESIIVVMSSSREKRVEVLWSAVQDIDNMVMFDLAGKGTLKLVSKEIPYLDTREEWVQDVDRIEVYPSP